VGDVESVAGRGMDVDAEERGVAVEETLPEGQHGKGTPGEEHEGHLGDSGVRVRFFLRHKRSPPEQFLVGKPVGQVKGMKEALKLIILRWRWNVTH